MNTILGNICSRDEQIMQQDINQIKTQLQTLNAAKGNRLKRFGAYIPNVLKKIEEEKGRFHKKPKGPIGKTIWRYREI